MNRVAVFFTLTIILASLIVIYTVAHWQLPQAPSGSNGHSKTWVLLQPVKCEELPWRSEWAKTHQKAYEDFPVDQEKTILTQYYSGRGVNVMNVTLTYQSIDATCTQCGCPEPFVFGIQTYAEDAAKLAASGFKIVDNSDPRIFTGPLFRQSTDQPISSVQEKDCDELFATQTILDDLLGNKKDSCYVQAAISAQNVDICQKVLSPNAHTTCVTEVATALQYPDACHVLNDTLSRDACLAGVASALGQKSVCAGIVDAQTKYFCELSAKSN